MYLLRLLSHSNRCATRVIHSAPNAATVSRTAPLHEGRIGQGTHARFTTRTFSKTRFSRCKKYMDMWMITITTSVGSVGYRHDTNHPGPYLQEQSGLHPNAVGATAKGLPVVESPSRYSLSRRKEKRYAGNPGGCACVPTSISNIFEVSEDSADGWSLLRLLVPTHFSDPPYVWSESWSFEGMRFLRPLPLREQDTNTSIE